MTFAILGALALAAPAGAGVRLDLETVDPKGASSEQRMELQGDKVRIDRFRQESTGTGGVNRIPGLTVIFNGAEVFTLDHRSKSYMVIDPGQLARMKQQANLPPEAQAQVDKAEKLADDRGRLTFKKGSGKDSVAGFSCVNYAELRDGADYASVCIAPWKSGPVKKEDLAGLLKFAKVMGPAETAKKAMLINPDEWPGFPLTSQSNDGHSSRLKSATREIIPDNEFQPPRDYDRKEMPGFNRADTP